MTQKTQAGTTRLTRGTTPIRLSEISISPLNRSNGYEFTADSTRTLVDDIKRNGLINPVTLVAITGGENTRYEIIAGANRIEALRGLRGDDGELTLDEYRLVAEGVSNGDLLQISLSENAERRALSPAGEAHYAARLLRVLNITQLKLAGLMRKTRQWIAAAIRLVDRWGELPASWQNDLQAAPDSREAEKAIVTFSHWLELSGKLPANSLGKGELELMEQARSEKWPARAMCNAMDSYVQRLGRGATVEEKEELGGSNTRDNTVNNPEPSTPPVEPTAKTDEFDVNDVQVPEFKIIYSALEQARNACGGVNELVIGISNLTARVRKIHKSEFPEVL